MIRFYRFILSLSMSIVFGILITAPAQPSPIPQAQGFFNWGVDNIVHGDYQGAIKNFTEAINGQSNLANAYSNRCFAYVQLGDYQTAIEDCTQASMLEPKNAEAYLNRGVAHYRQGHYQAAIEDNNQVIQLKPYDFRGYYNRGVASSGLGNHTEAIVDYNQALGQSPKLPSRLLADIYNDRGLARFRLADYQGAIADFSFAIRINANDSRAYYNRGCACQSHGDNRGAIHDFTQSLRFNPANAEAYVNRGIARHQLGYQQAAIEDLQKAAKDFVHHGDRVASQKTLELIKSIQQLLLFDEEIALVSPETMGAPTPTLAETIL